MNSLQLKLEPGSDLRQAIEDLSINRNLTGFILGVVGNLSSAAFQCPGRSEPTVLKGNLEIITLNGTFSPSGVHLHLSLSDGDCQVWGGHLEPGTTVLKGADLLLGLLQSEPSTNGSDLNDNNKKHSRIEIAVIPGCPWCSRALRILNSTGLIYNVITVDDDQYFEEVKSRSSESTFPQVFIDGNYIGGYEALSELKASGKLFDLA